MSRPVGYRFPLAERFWAKVNKTDTCWLWTATTYPDGYGSFHFENRMVPAGRIAWFLHYGEHVPEGLKVLHKCDNPPCVNPLHLFLGTDLDNVRDREAKGRGVRQYGSAHPNAKLTESDVIKIRTRRALGETLESIAKDFSISFSNVSMICVGRAWQHV